MSRVVVSNGELAVALDEFACVSDVYYPYVGQNSHSHGMRHRLGIMVDDKFNWLDDGNWRIKQRLIETTLVSHTIAVNDQLGILLEIDDCVSSRISALLRSIHVVNLFDRERRVKLFTHQGFVFDANASIEASGELVTDHQAIIHYGGRRAFVAGGVVSSGEGFDQSSVGRFGDGLEGTWRDAEDGELTGCTHETGKVDSVMRFSLDIPTHASIRVQYWLTAAASATTALTLHQLLQKEGLASHLEKTIRSWSQRLAPSQRIASKLPAHVRRPFMCSLLATLSLIDMHGAVLTEGRNGYVCQPRHAAMTLWPLIRLGFNDEALRFFNFCKQRLTNDRPYLLRGYFADGTIAPGAAHYFDPKAISAEDSAAVLFIVTQYLALNPRDALHHDLYTGLVVPLAQFVCDQNNPETTLDPSGTVFVAALSHAALLAASDVAEHRGSQSHSVAWRARAEDIKHASMSLYDESRGYFRLATHDDTISVEAFYGAFMFGLVDIHSEQLAKTAAAVDRLHNSGGLYRRREHDEDADMQASLWMAQYFMEVGETARSERIITAISSRISTTGSIYQLDGSHRVQPAVSAEFVNTLLDMITRP